MCPQKILSETQVYRLKTSLIHFYPPWVSYIRKETDTESKPEAPLRPTSTQIIHPIKLKPPPQKGDISSVELIRTTW